MNITVPIRVTLEVKVPAETIAAILHKSLEDGGSLHWLLGPRRNNIYTLLTHNLLMLLGVDGTEYTLTLEKLSIGLQHALPYLGSAISGGLLVAKAIDTDSADMILQMSLFSGDIPFD